MKKFKYFIFVILVITATIAFAAATDKYFQSTGNIILDPGSSGNVQIKKELRTDKITNLAGTSGAPGMVPLGGMVAVMPTTHVNLWQPPATGVIKDGFMRADGHIITAQNVTDGSIIPAGTTLPSMIAKYPRGNTTSGTSSGSNTQASNVTVGNHATLGISNHTTLSLNNHTFTQPSAHSISTPAHYHNSFSLTAAGHSLGSTYPTLRSFDGAPFTTSAGSTCGGSPNGIYGNSGGCYPSNQAANTVDIAHSHPASSVSGTVGNQGGSNGDASFTDSITNNHSGGGVDGHSFSQNISNHSFSQNIDSHTVTNNAVNNEPAYVEVVWVIRVK